MEKLTEADYFSMEAELFYTGSTQIKNFLKCENETLAKINGCWIEEKSDALLESSYIDEYFSGTLENFKLEHPEMFTQKGELYAKYKKLDDIITQAENDNMFMKYINGKHQVIMTGEIAGVPVKIKIDSFHENKCIVDLKAIKDLKLIWNEETREKQNFIDYYDYVLQGALYQEIVRQNTGKKLPFVIAVLTKEKISERALLNIPQELLNEKLAFLENYLPHVKKLKEGKIEPTECGKCDYYKSQAKVSKVLDYKDYFDMRGGI